MLNIVRHCVTAMPFAIEPVSPGCWITSHYPGERIGLEYAWMWVAALVDIFVYISLALVVTGYVTVNGGKIRITTGEERVPMSLTSSRGSAGSREGTTMATKLLFYPAVYLITVSLKPSKQHISYLCIS